MAQHGTRYGERRALLRDRILAMKALWTEDEASYDGEFVQIEPSWAWPKPAQRPHPPIVLGGAAGPEDGPGTSPSSATAGCRSAGVA